MNEYKRVIRMPWHLYRRGLSAAPAGALTASEAEWKLFQHLRRSVGGFSGLLLFQFCLSLYVVLWGGTRVVGSQSRRDRSGLDNVTASAPAPSSTPSSLLYCPMLTPWMVSYTATLFVFRVSHEAAVLWWRDGTLCGQRPRVHGAMTT